MEELCRLCALAKTYQVPILDNECCNISKKIKNCVRIQVEQDDYLPKTICTQCLSILNSFNEFIFTCSQSQITLNKLYKKPETLPYAIQEENVIRNESNLEENDLMDSSIEVLVDEIKVENTEEDKPEEMVDYDSISDVEYAFSEVHEYNSNKSSAKREPQINRNEYRQLECCECQFLVRGAKEMEKHFFVVHGKKAIFKCPRCGKIFQRYRSYTRHVLAHIQLPKFACELCNKTFSQKINLQNHMVIHSKNITNYECEKCGKEFKHASSVYKHLRTHFGIKISCDECGEKFVSEETLRNHKKAIHLKEKNEICMECGKSYATKQALHYHSKVVHKADVTKKSKCQICSKYLATSTSLKRHLFSHSISLINKEIKN